MKPNRFLAAFDSPASLFDLPLRAPVFSETDDAIVSKGLRVKLHVLGCHGGETPKHRTSSFVLDGKLAIDAGALTSELELKEQYALEAVAVSHAHMDHIRDLATVADNRVQVGTKPLVIAGTAATIAILKKHFFNDLLWPDFAKIASKGKLPTIRYQELPLDKPSMVECLKAHRRSVLIATWRITMAPPIPIMKRHRCPRPVSSAILRATGRLRLIINRPRSR